MFPDHIYSLSNNLKYSTSDGLAYSEMTIPRINDKIKIKYLTVKPVLLLGYYLLPSHPFSV